MNTRQSVLFVVKKEIRETFEREFDKHPSIKVSGKIKRVNRYNRRLRHNTYILVKVRLCGTVTSLRYYIKDHGCYYDNHPSIPKRQRSSKTLSYTCYGLKRSVTQKLLKKSDGRMLYRCEYCTHMYYRKTIEEPRCLICHNRLVFKGFERYFERSYHDDNLHRQY